jgi:NAD(P)-dependent dehydrogenase (short-subunit alcohol dehydrogenase family)
MADRQIGHGYFCMAFGFTATAWMQIVFDSRLMTGQRVLVTGGGSGLGKAMAEGFLALGADVVICGRRKAVCDTVGADWRKRFPGQSVTTYGVDIRNAEAVEAMIEAIWAEAPLTGLVNNAAGNFVAQTQDLSSRGFDAVANTVFHGTFYVTNAVGKRWVAEAKEGGWAPGAPYRSVLSIITSWVLNGSPYVVPSAMSKAGVAVMTKSLAVEWAKYGIRLNAVGPGEIPTEGMTKRLNPGEKAGKNSVLSMSNPMGRVGELSELQNLASFLLAPGKCDWLSGETIMMDGANALATGGNFYALNSWADEDWRGARAAIESQNSKDKDNRAQPEI